MKRLLSFAQEILPTGAGGRCSFMWALLLAGFAGLTSRVVGEAPPRSGRGLANSLFYLPTRDEPATPETWGYPFRHVDFASSDGTRLHGWWIESRVKPVRGTVVFSHGNAGSMGHHLGFALWLTRAGYEVLMFDYRGYGRSKGYVHRKGMIEDVRAALIYASRNGSRPGQPLISYGHSLGGAKSLAAIAMGKIDNLRAVVIDSTFASYHEMARLIGGRLVASMVSDEFAPIDAVAAISPIPLLVIHGKRDPVVPFAQGLRLFQAAGKPKTLFEVPEGNHGNCLSRDNGTYRKRMLEWLEEKLKQ